MRQNQNVTFQKTARLPALYWPAVAYRQQQEYWRPCWAWSGHHHDTEIQTRLEELQQQETGKSYSLSKTRMGGLCCVTNLQCRCSGLGSPSWFPSCWTPSKTHWTYWKNNLTEIGTMKRTREGKRIQLQTMITHMIISKMLGFFVIPDTGRLCGGSTPVPEHKYECRCFPHSETKSDKCILRCFLISSCLGEKKKRK